MNAPKEKGRVRAVKAGLYKSHHIVVLYFKPDLFGYFTEYNGQIYFGYNIITPREGETELSEQEIIHAANLTWYGGEATIDTKLGHVVDAQMQKDVERFESVRDSVEDTDAS